MPLDAELPQETDVLIVGSGFGGSVMAKELAGRYESICLVERGKAYPPGSFPRDPAGVSRNFWDPSADLLGMFNVWTFENLDAIVSSGLGGGSLIYANVMLRKDKSWFTQRRPGTTSPETWTLTPDDLEEHYDAVEDFLQVQELPRNTADETVSPQFNLPKTRLFLESTESAGGDGGYAPLAVRFRTADGLAVVGAPLATGGYRNIHGPVNRSTCRLIGECDLGCNEGAKNSLDHTYLSYASAKGVSVHTLTEVMSITRRVDDPDGYLFDVTVRDLRFPEGEPIPPIKARRVVLAAGALGTTYLLLANKENLDLYGAPIGQRFCGNGDVLGLISGAAEDLDCTRGPVITAYRRYAAETDGDDDPGRDPDSPIQHGMYIEDAGYPAFAAWLVQIFGDGPGMLGSALGQWLEKVRLRILFRRKDTNLSAEVNKFLAGGTLAARFMPLLGMGRDTPDGTLFLLENGMMDSGWSLKTSASYLETMDARMASIAEGLGGEYRQNPLRRMFNRLITVHPVGGCPSDTNRFMGVVDTYGRVRGVPGLRVCDGSVFPGPVGPNPSLTIAAFARRSAMNLREAEPDPRQPPSVADDYTGT